FAKLPPLSDDAKAKAAEAAAKTAWTDKVASFQLCKAQDKAAANHVATMKREGKDAKPPIATPACADPGPYASPASAPAATPVAAAAAPAPKPAKK
ncbi:MAG TPA: hypothetical protein VJ598_09650, partial [Albitalea sp.]|nr:hypothetical protein [Albitalea sp.]